MPLILVTVSYGKSARRFAGGWEHCRSACRIANALIKDQVTPMLFRKHIVSTRTLFQLTVALVFLVAAVGAAVAAGPNNPPLLVPYTINSVAGTPQYSTVASPAIIVGYGGDAGPAVPYATGAIGTSTAVTVGGATLSTPYGFAVDSVGNVYIADHGNDVIREVNAQTGFINTIAGAVPTGCKAQTGTVNSLSCTVVPGCTDGGPAYGSKIGTGLEGVAVDSFGNVYFVDTTTSTVSIVYRGGTRVANFIALVNPAAVAASPSGQVTVGYLYHVAGEVNLTTCTGSTTNAGLIIDNAPAFENTASPGAILGATLHSPSNITLDSAGNIYVSDNGNSTVRVINTQATAQTFFQYTVQPGYMRAITNCFALTTPCPATVTAAVGTGINGPANGITYNSQYVEGVADAYGNVYQLNGTGSGTGVPGIYVPGVYAGGTPLTNLLTAEAPHLVSTYSSTETAFPVPASDKPTPNELPLTYGTAYVTIGNPTLAGTLPGAFLNIQVNANNEYNIRATSLMPDSAGTFYYYDNHFAEVSRIDQFTSDATGLTWIDALTNSPQRGTTTVAGLNTTDKVTNANGTVSNYNTAQPASFTNPWNCVYGWTTGAWTQGPQTYGVAADGCPSTVARVNGGKYYTLNDGLGNLYMGDSADELIREIQLGIQFPAVPVVPVGGPAAYSATTTYAAGNTVSYQGLNYTSLIASNKGNTPGATPSAWILLTVTQPIQIHFDVSNIPVTGGAGTPPTVSIQDGPALGYTAAANAFTITGSGDFTINTTTPEFPLGSLNVPITGLPMGWGENASTANFAMWTGGPTCTQLGLSSPDNSWDCLVYVNFNPLGPGLRTGQLVVTTANGSVYNFPLTGVGTGGQLAIDGGQSQSVVAATGLGSKTPAVAVSSAGAVYIADTNNNRIVVEPAGGGTQTAIGPTITLVSPLVSSVTTATVSQTPTDVDTFSTVTTTLSGPMGVALDAANNVYISDTGNNRVLEYNPNTGTATQLGNYLWVPGATCDGANQAADCPSKSSPIGTTLANETGASVTPTTAPPQYTFKAPQGLAVDQWGNVYVADTGNAAVVEIPSNTQLGGATPLMQYPGSTTTFVNPVAVAIGPATVTSGAIGISLNGFIFVADTGNSFDEIVRLPPGGGDLQPGGVLDPGSALSVVISAPLFGGTSIGVPNGVAVDATGNVYVSDSATNSVLEVPFAGAPSLPFAINFSGLSGPAGLAVDANGNLYVADSGNSRVLFMNRQNPTVPFGTVPLGQTSASQPLCANTTISNGLNIGNNGNCVLTVTNTGNKPVTLTSPFLGTVSNTQFTVTSTCTSPIAAGTSCTITPLYTPTADGAPTPSGSFTVNGTQSVALTANGAHPEVVIAMAPTNGTLVTGSTTSYTAAAGAETVNVTVTQPHPVAGPLPPGTASGPLPTPSGTVTFNWVIDAGTANAGLCGTSGSTGTAPVGATSGTSGPLTLNGSGQASYAMPALYAGETYTVSALFTPGSTDTTDSITSTQAPILITVPATSSNVEAVTAASVTYQYGAAVPKITGTVSPALPAGITVTFTSPATSTSPVGIYPIQAVFSGSATGVNFCQLAFPPAYSSGTTAATVTETKAPLAVTIPAYTTVYGAPTFNYASGMVVTGLVGTDKVSATFTPANSSTLAVSATAYVVTATMTGKNIGNYSITPNPPTGTDLVTTAPSTMAITAAKTSIAISAAGTASTVTGATYTVTLATSVPAGNGVPTGTVSVTDYFVPITSTIFVPTPTSGAFTAVNGAYVWPTTAAYGVQYVLIPSCSATVTTGCNPVVTLSAGTGTFTLPNLAINGAGGSGSAPPIGTHYLSFAYSGDNNFACSVIGQFATASCPSSGTVPYALIIDNPDFTLTSTTGPINLSPGVIPSGNGLPTLPNQNSSYPQSAILSIGGILAFGGTTAPGSPVNLSCVVQDPVAATYMTCAVGQVQVVNGIATQPQPLAYVLNGATVAVVFEVQTPVHEPLGFNTVGKLRMSATRTVLAFLPFGVLAFCVRRRRRLSKALWMLIAIAAVSVGMSGCGGNQVDIYTPIPAGQQLLTVNAMYTAGTTVPAQTAQPTVTRSYVIPINIQ
jgi:sugar lactone lactonase YvrE